MTDTVKSWIDLRREAISRRSEPESDWTVDDSYHELPRALTALEQVLELHVKETGGTPDGGVADVCSCGVSYWPCPTVQAIEGAINE